MCIYGQRDLSVMDFWRDKYVTCVCPPKVSWSYRYDKSLLCHLFLKLLAAWKMCRLKKSSKDGVLTDIGKSCHGYLKIRVWQKRDTWHMYGNHLMRSRAYFELEMSQVGVNGYLPSRKKSMKIQSSMRSRELSWQNFQITFWHFLLLFLLYINRKKLSYIQEK